MDTTTEEFKIPNEVKINNKNDKKIRKTIRLYVCTLCKTRGKTLRRAYGIHGLICDECYKKGIEKGTLSPYWKLNKAEKKKLKKERRINYDNKI